MHELWVKRCSLEIFRYNSCGIALTYSSHLRALNKGGKRDSAATPEGHEILYPSQRVHSITETILGWGTCIWPCKSS